MSTDGDALIQHAHVAGTSVQVLESCHSTWIFDPERGRFRRAARGSDMDVPAPDHEWEDYYGLELLPDSDAFIVKLNEAGTKLLRAYRHTDGCTACSEEPTSELSVTDLAAKLTAGT